MPYSAEVYVGNNVGKMAFENCIIVSEETITFKTYPNHFIAKGEWIVYQIEITDDYAPNKMN